MERKGVGGVAVLTRYTSQSRIYYMMLKAKETDIPRLEAYILLIFGEIDLVRRVAPGWDFNQTFSRTKEELEKNTKENILQFKAILSLQQSNHLPEKTIICAPLALSQRPLIFMLSSIR